MVINGLARERSGVERGANKNIADMIGFFIIIISELVVPDQFASAQGFNPCGAIPQNLKPEIKQQLCSDLIKSQNGGIEVGSFYWNGQLIHACGGIEGTRNAIKVPQRCLVANLIAHTHPGPSTPHSIADLNLIASIANTTGSKVTSMVFTSSGTSHLISLPPGIQSNFINGLALRENMVFNLFSNQDFKNRLARTYNKSYSDQIYHQLLVLAWFDVLNGELLQRGVQVKTNYSQADNQFRTKYQGEIALFKQSL